MSVGADRTSDDAEPLEIQSSSTAPTQLLMCDDAVPAALARARRVLDDDDNDDLEAIETSRAAALAARGAVLARTTRRKDDAITTDSAGDAYTIRLPAPPQSSAPSAREGQPVLSDSARVRDAPRAAIELRAALLHRARAGAVAHQAGRASHITLHPLRRAPTTTAGRR